MLIPFVCSLVLVLSGAASVDAQVVQLETRDGRILVGKLSELVDGRLRIDTTNGPSSIPLSELLLLSVQPRETPPADPALESALGPPDLLLLASPSGRAGDRLVGRVVGGDTFGLSFAIDGGATFEVPFEECRGMTLS